MQRLALILLFGLPTAIPPLPAPAAEVPNNRIVKIEAPRARMPTVKPVLVSKTEVRQFFQEMAARDLIQQNRAALAANGLTPTQIEDFLKSPEFRDLLRNVIHHPRVVKAIDRVVDALMSPDSNTKRNRRMEDDEVAERKLLLRAAYITQRLALTPTAPFKQPGFWAQLWERGKRYLYD
jgi:hypothetical protein